MAEEITLVTQYTPRACVYACLEMVCYGKIDQREIHRDMKKYRDDANPRGEFRQLVRMGFLPIRSPFNELINNSLMLVTVPSLNCDRVNHRVVIDMRNGTEKLYDPNEGRKGGTYKSDLSDLLGFSEVTFVVDCYKAKDLTTFMPSSVLDEAPGS